MPRLLTAVALLALPGCLFAPDLSGSWEGSMECDDGPEIGLEMDLDADGGGEFSGEFIFAFEDSQVQEGVTYDLAFDIEYAIVIEAAGAGEQELDGDVELEDVSCSLYADGQLMTDSCEEMGLDEDDLSDEGDVDDLIWDGADTIEVEDGDCEGEAER